MANYHKGANDERFVIECARADGCEAVRAAGSHGLADVIVVNAMGFAFAVNVKRNAWAPPAERALMAKRWRRVKVAPVLARVSIAGGERVLTWRAVRPGGAMGRDGDEPPWT